MKTAIIQQLHTSFEDVAHEQDGVEFWLARDLQILLGYDEWRNFTKVIDKAKESCEKAGVLVEDQFVEVNKLKTHGKSGQRGIADVICHFVKSNKMVAGLRAKWSTLAVFGGDATSVRKVRICEIVG
jgi:hypothetical protein